MLMFANIFKKYRCKKLLLKDVTKLIFKKFDNDIIKFLYFLKRYF